MQTSRGPLRWVYDLLSLPIATKISDRWLKFKFSLLNTSASRASSKVRQPKVTLVIPVFNVERYVELCLTSVQAQNYENLEVIVVNDGSQDGSMQKVARFASRLNIRVVDQTNQGLAAARNAGVAAIDQTDYLMFIDSDDALQPLALQTLVRQLENSGSDFAVGDCTRMKGVTRVPRVDTRGVYASGSRSRVAFSDAPAVIRDVTAWNKMFRWSFFDANRFIFPKGVYFEDMAEMTRAYIEADSFDIVAKSIYLWRVRTEGEKSITQSASHEKQFADRFAALQQMKDLLADAVRRGRATTKNLEAFADRLRTHDSKLHPDRTKDLDQLAAY